MEGYRSHEQPVLHFVPSVLSVSISFLFTGTGNEGDSRLSKSVSLIGNYSDILYNQTTGFVWNPLSR